MMFWEPSRAQVVVIGAGLIAYVTALWSVGDDAGIARPLIGLGMIAGPVVLWRVEIKGRETDCLRVPNRMIA